MRVSFLAMARLSLGLQRVPGNQKTQIKNLKRQHLEIAKRTRNTKFSMFQPSHKITKTVILLSRAPSMNPKYILKVSRLVT